MSHEHVWLDVTEKGDEYAVYVCAKCYVQVEHWHINDLESLVTACDQCGERRVCQLVMDPFVVEGIADEPIEEEWWCYPCFDQRAGDV